MSTSNNYGLCTDPNIVTYNDRLLPDSSRGDDGVIIKIAGSRRAKSRYWRSMEIFVFAKPHKVVKNCPIAIGQTNQH